MKKALLILAIAAVACQAKAQQLFRLKPADSLKNDLFQLYRAPQPNTQPLLIQPRTDPGLLNLTARVKIDPYDHMPTLLLNSDDKMPVMKSNTVDRMPVMRMGDYRSAEFVPAPRVP